MGSRQNRIQQILENALSPRRIEVEDESHHHGGPLGETHFKILIISEKFEGLSRVARHRLVHDLLRTEFSEGLHALAQKALTPSEWEAQNGKTPFQSPPCLGGSKKSNR